jgi:acyl-CoA thioester hydrolase
VTSGRLQIGLPEDSRPRYSMMLRVRQYEVDILGHVNNVIYLHYLEQAAVEHADSLGFTRIRLEELGGTFVVRRHEVEYSGGAQAGDILEVTTWVESFSGARATRNYVVAHAGTGKRIVSALTVWAWVDARTGLPRPLPPEILAAFSPPEPRDG